MFFFFPMQLSAQSGLDLEFKPGGKYMERWQFLAHAGSSANLANFYYSIGCHIPACDH